jgi:hypothetical protein
MFYFPLIPRLLATYRSPRIAPHMTYHAKHKSSDGIMRGPYDGEAWQAVLDNPECDFMAKEDRNVWLGMAMDGMNPFSNNSSSHSLWPVLLVLYNLPPWMAIQKGNIILSCIVPGKHSNRYMHNYGTCINMLGIYGNQVPQRLFMD